MVGASADVRLHENESLDYEVSVSGTNTLCDIGGETDSLGSGVEAVPLPPLVQGEAGTLFSAGGAGLPPLRLVCRVQLETANSNRR